MKPGKRFGLSAEQKIDVWRRWKAGQTLHEIGRAFVAVLVSGWKNNLLRLRAKRVLQRLGNPI